LRELKDSFNSFPFVFPFDKFDVSSENDRGSRRTGMIHFGGRHRFAFSGLVNIATTEIHNQLNSIESMTIATTSSFLA
jgi:hypothetical protein